MRINRPVVGFTASVWLAVAPVYAGQHGHSPRGGSHAATTQGHGHKSTKPTTTTTTTTQHGHKAPKTAGTTTATGTTSTAPVTNVAPTPTPSPSKLATRLQPLLASTGLTFDQARAGFKTKGQCIAALHVAQNLNISFNDLKTRMTGPEHLSLGQAIQASKTGTNATLEATRAQHQAQEDLKITQTVSTTTTTQQRGKAKDRSGR